MPLQGDQRALLQLLCERGQSYEDISGLLGISADEVRGQARTALKEIGGADPDAEVGLTDFLLGQADPVGRADAIRFLQGSPEGLELSRRIQEGLSEIAPEAKQPTLPEPRGRRRRAALPDASTPASDPAASRERGPDSGGGRAKLIAALVATGVILAFVILAIAGAFSGDDQNAASSTTAAGGESTTAANESSITAVPLEPVAGSGVAGEAAFGLVGDEQLYVDVDVQGLDPDLPDGNTYLVWLMIGEAAGYPIDRLEPDENGGFSGRLAVPTPIAVAVGNQAKSVQVSSTPVDELQSQIERAAEQEVPVLPFVGTELASGEIPLVKRSDQGGQSGQNGQSGN